MHVINGLPDVHTITARPDPDEIWNMEWTPSRGYNSRLALPHRELLATARVFDAGSNEGRISCENRRVFASFPPLTMR